MFTLLRTVHKNPAKLIVFILKNEGLAQLYIIFLVLESMNTLKIDWKYRKNIYYEIENKELKYLLI